MVEAGVTDPEEIEKTLQNMGDATIEKELKVERIDGTYTSTVTIRVTNNSGKVLKNGTVIELIPKSLVSDSSLIQSDQPFEIIGETDEYWILQWSYDSLAPGETLVFSYTVAFELSTDILTKSNTLFSAERREEPPAEMFGTITINVSFEGIAQEGITVTLYSEGRKVAESTTDAAGNVSFPSLPAGPYYIITGETAKFESYRSETIQLAAGGAPSVSTQLQEKQAVTPTPIPVLPVDNTWLMWLVIILIILALLYIFREHLLLELFGGAKKKPPKEEAKAVGLAAAAKKMEKEEAKRPFKKYRGKHKEHKPEKKPEKHEHKPEKKEHPKHERKPEPKPAPKPEKKHEKPKFGKREEPKRSFKKFRESREK